jgi:hypothetical protein
MPSHLVKRINLDLLYPPFLARLLDVLAECEFRGAPYYCTLGTRTFAEQAKLYFQGRTTPGPIVTNAPAGSSLHNFGCAVDVVRDGDLAKVGLQPDWGKEGYQILKEEAEKAGLQQNVPGLNDYGHVQVRFTANGRKEKDILAECKKRYLAAPKGSELAAAWMYLDQLKLLP